MKNKTPNGPIDRKSTTHEVVTEGFALTGSRSPPLTTLLIYHRHGVTAMTLSEAEPALVGRESLPDVQDVKLSRRHARFELIDGELWVEDLRSTNGTWIQGQRIERAKLKARVQVCLGSDVVVSCVTGAPEREGPQSHDVFLRSLNDEVQRCHAFGRPVGVIFVRSDNPGTGHISSWSQRITASLRGVDRIGLYGPDQIEILLPEAGPLETEKAAQAIIDGAMPEEPPLRAGIAVYPESGRSAEELISVAKRASLRATEDRPIAGHDDRLDVYDRGEALDGETRPLVQSPKMVVLYAQVQRLARTPISVLIVGETGSGKELVARALHEAQRPDKPMCCLNCGAIPEHLIESMLFGHERGAFTGADRRKPGIFEAARGGTVFLDEVGELPLAAQAALLRVLETRHVTRVGAMKEIPIDARVLAATHRDLEQMCEKGTFRWDLLYRLNTMVLRVPSLRERQEEILPLAEHFLKMANRTSARQIGRISAHARRCLMNYYWPGNVRELRNVIERAVIVADGAEIRASDLLERVRQAGGGVRRAVDLTHTGERQRTTTAVLDQPAVELEMTAPEHRPRLAKEVAPGGMREKVQRVEAGLILAALQASDWNQTRAAQRLRMPLRTLVHKVGIYSLRDDPSPVDPVPLYEGEDLRSRIEHLEIALIREALQITSGNRSGAARHLRIGQRTLSRKLERYGLG